MKRIASILFILTLSIGSVHAISLADSIRQEMRHLEGQDLLQAHSNLCQLAATQDDMQYELRCIREFLAEAMNKRTRKPKGWHASDSSIATTITTIWTASSSIYRRRSSL